MLKLGGYINILIALAHLVGLFWAEQMFEVTGIEMEINELAKIHASIPYLVTILVSIIFFMFGLYGLSAAGNFSKLPFLKFAIFGIAGIYMFRGLAELVVNIMGQKASPLIETVYSFLALAIGLLFLFGGIKKWNQKAA